MNFKACGILCNKSSVTMKAIDKIKHEKPKFDKALSLRIGVLPEFYYCQEGKQILSLDAFCWLVLFSSISIFI